MEASKRVGKTTRAKATEMEASSRVGKTTRANTAQEKTIYLKSKRHIKIVWKNKKIAKSIKKWHFLCHFL